ncbi:MAG: nickel pincer cofactor biosynthesis protein LarB [Bacillota bacterium]|nr:nickel pincer cofactor biosynthesis protein LarB [Bacillota bacterium]
MNESYIKDVLEKVKTGQIDESEAYTLLRELPYKEMGFANVDHHRTIRTGFPEVIYCEGKTSPQIRDIFIELASRQQETQCGLMGTRATENDYACVAEALPDAIYHKQARIIELPFTDPQNPEAKAGPAKGRVSVVTAGTADIPVAEEAAVTAEVLGNQVNRIYDVGVAGIHRLFDKLDLIREGDVVIVVAGMEGALASVVGGLVDSPVIAVPTSVGYGANFQGLSALLSMLNSCANGVAVVNIDNGFGAAYMASVINSKR